MATFDRDQFIREQVRKNLSSGGVSIGIPKGMEQDRSFFEKMFDVLRTAEYAMGGIISGKGIVEGVKQRVSPSQALGVTNGFVSLLTDIFLDPTTYLTMGTGGALKLTTKAGASIALTKSGSKAFFKLSKKVGAVNARKQFAEIALRNPDYINKGGLKWMGQTIIPQSAFTKVNKFAKDNIMKIPHMDKLGNKVTRVVNMFDPDYALRSNKVTADFADRYKFFTKGVRAKERKFIEDTAKLERPYYKKYGKEFTEHVTHYAENNSYLNKLEGELARDVKKIGDQIVEGHDMWAKIELKKGILNATLGEVVFKGMPKDVRKVVYKYVDDIIDGTIKTSDEFKSVLTKKELDVISKGGGEFMKALKEMITEHTRELAKTEKKIFKIKSINKGVFKKLESVKKDIETLSGRTIGAARKIIDSKDYTRIAKREADMKKSIEGLIELEAKSPKKAVAELTKVKNKIQKDLKETIDVYSKQNKKLKKEIAALKNKNTKKAVEKIELQKDVERLLKEYNKEYQTIAKEISATKTLGKSGVSRLKKLEKDIEYLIKRMTETPTGLLSKQEAAGIIGKSTGVIAKIDYLLDIGIKNPEEALKNLGFWKTDLQTTIKELTGEYKALLAREKELSKMFKGKNSYENIFNQIKNTEPNVDAYIRHTLTEKGKKYVRDKGGGVLYNALPKSLRAKLGAGETRNIRKAIKDINDEMREKVGGDMFEADAFKAFAFRGVEHIRAVESKRFLDEVVKDYGKLAMEGEKVRIDQGLKYVRSTNKHLDGYLVPEEIARSIDKTMEVLTADRATNEVLKHYDKIHSIWKGSVTGWFIAFHTRNAIGGIYNNWLAKIDVSSYKKYADLEIDLKKGGNKMWVLPTGETKTTNQLLNEAKKVGAINQPGMIDVMMELEDLMGKTTFQKLGNFPKVAMETVENAIRMPLYLDRRLKGFSARDAAKEVWKFHYDYSPEGLKPFERNVMRRFIPFYTWTSRNVPLQLEQFAKQPAKYGLFPKARDALAGEEGREEYKNLPEWMKNIMTVKLGENAGASMWLQLNLPIDDLNKLPLDRQGVKELTTLLTPFLKVPMELIANRDFFFGKDIVDPNLPKEFQTAKAIEQVKYIPTPLKEFLNIRKVKYKTKKKGKVVWEERYEMDAVKLHLLQGAVGRYYSTVGQMFDKDKSFAGKVLRLIVGMPVQELDMETQKYYNTYQKEKEERAIKSYLKPRKFD